MRLYNTPQPRQRSVWDQIGMSEFAGSERSRSQSERGDAVIASRQTWTKPAQKG